jgi:DNA-binding NtrC family response regulator
MASNERVRILVVDDEEIVRESLAGWLDKDGYAVEQACDGPSALARLADQPFSIVITDLKMPGMDGLALQAQARKLRPDLAVVIMTAYATVDTAVTAMKQGAFDYLVKPFDPEELSMMMQKIVAQQELVRENAVLRKALKKEHRLHDLASKAPAMQAVFELARSAARSASTILILGESGSGKEVLARAIHAESPRVGGPFVEVSCAALTETLLESELFGHEKGSFTGASARRQGKFEIAHQGTLFLDEIGDIGPKLQVDLLRVLEERRFCRIGGNQPVEVDVRIIAAPTGHLLGGGAPGSFREDLYYRLNVIPIRLPPLRDRREDLPLLVEQFLERLSAELEREIEGVSAEAMAALMAHPWPGNIRELRNVLERGAVVARGAIIELGDLGLARGDAAGPSGTGPVTVSSPTESLDDVERRHIAAVLAHTGFNVSQSARVLGVDRVTLYAKMRKYGLKRDGEDEPTR